MTIRTVVGISLLSLTAITAAHANIARPLTIVPNYPPVSAPEIDPSSAFSGLMLLAGGLAVVRGRSKRS